MSAKKTSTKKVEKKPVALVEVIITMGMFKGKHGFLTKKKAVEGYAIVNIIDGPEIMISKNFISK
jgi:hypothetical protein